MTPEQIAETLQNLTPEQCEMATKTCKKNYLGAIGTAGIKRSKRKGSRKTGKSKGSRKTGKSKGSRKHKGSKKRKGSRKKR